MYTGSCLCGQIQYTINGELAPVQLCHCQQCRKAQGSAFAANIPVDVADFTVTRGADVLKEYESTSVSGKFRQFCSHCGSPLFSKLASAPGVVRVRAGTINENINSGLAHNQFVAHKANWWKLDDTLPCFDERPV